ncbi:MAG: hypothetical protein KC425_05515, partial [Anaerolineales bacterium]|nr:hypothetical protein [Anaerolineales bacterium]
MRRLVFWLTVLMLLTACRSLPPTPTPTAVSIAPTPSPTLTITPTPAPPEFAGQRPEASLPELSPDTPGSRGDLFRSM